MKKFSGVIGLALLSSLGGETFAGFNNDLDGVKSEIQKRKTAFEERRKKLEKQTQELEEFNCLIRIPEILDGFCKGNDTPENLTQTSQYLSEFTSHYLAHKLGKQQLQHSREEDSSQDVTMNQQSHCSICTDEIEGDENHALLGCTHSCHLECIRPSLRSYLEQEKPESLTRCQQDGCDYKLNPSELASLVENSDQALAIQRLFVRSVDVLKFCPSCGEGIAKHSRMLGFGYHCQECDKDMCFSCGRPPHHDISCEEIGTNEGVRKAFIAELLKTGKAESYGLCPSCKALIEKLDGCDSMTCGENAQDKKQIPGSVQGRGCGHKFSWSQRIQLKNASSQGQSSSSGSGRAQVQTPMTATQDRPQVVAQNTTPGLTLEERRTQAGIIRIEANDPRVRDFPEFAALGDMYQVGNLLLSGVAPQGMGYAKANRFCDNLDAGARNWFGQRPAGGALAPTNAEWRGIGQTMGRETPAGYNRDLIPGMNNRWFWSSSPTGLFNAWYFGGSLGNVGYVARDEAGGSVRCVRQVAW